MDKVSTPPTTEVHGPSTNQGPLPAQRTSLQATKAQEQEALLSYRALLIQKASHQIPYTAEGLPVGFYRSDLLPTQQCAPTEEVQALKNAFCDLSFDSGYPTLPDGRPFWHKLDFEPGFAYGAFQIYLELINSGPREISQLYENQELLVLASRSIGLTDQVMPKAQLGRMIQEFSVLYYWRSRSKAHDIYKEAAARHIRLRRQMNVEDNHYSIAEGLLRKLKTEIFEGGEAFWAEMSPKTAVDFLKALVLIQRVSVGLPASGPLSQKEMPDDVSFEMIMRTLGQKMNPTGTTFENGANGFQGGRQLLEHVLQDSSTAKQFQEVIIRVQKAAKESVQLQNPYQGAEARRFKGRPGRQNGNGTTEHAITADDIVPFDLSGAPGENLDGNAEVIDVTPTKSNGQGH